MFNSKVLNLSACAAVALASTSVLAYRTDHGFLTNNGIPSQCDAHPPVTLQTPSNAAPVPNPLLGEFSNGFYHIGDLGDGLYYLTDGVYQSLVAVAKSGLILVDAPPSIGVNSGDPTGQSNVSFLDVVYDVPGTAGKDIKRLIYSHSHLDHIGAASLVKEAFPHVKIIAHSQTRRQLARGDGSEGGFLQGLGALPPPLPTQVFDRQTVVNLDKQRFELSYNGPIHEPGNIFIFAPHQEVLMLVDTVFPGQSPFSDLALAEDIPLYLNAHDLILSFPFETFVGGHLNRLGTRADVEEAQRYFSDIKTNAKAALFDFSLFSIFFVPSPDVPGAPLGATNALGAFAIYLDQVACKCANLTLDPATTPSGTAWLERLGAADINTVGHCWQVAEALRIDPTFSAVAAGGFDDDSDSDADSGDDSDADSDADSAEDSGDSD